MTYQTRPWQRLRSRQLPGVIWARFFGHSEQNMLGSVAALAAGCAMYFLSPREPGMGLILALTILGGMALFRQLIPVWLMSLIAGMALSQAHTHLMAPVLLATPITAEITARLTHLRPSQSGGWQLRLCDIVVDNENASGLGAPNNMPDCAQVYSRIATMPPVQLGDTVAMTARLEPLMPPAYPGGYDGRLKDYFARIGARGIVFGDIAIIRENQDFTIDQFRQRLFITMGKYLDGDHLGLTAAMMLGQRGYMSAQAQSNLQKAGLAHLLAISGLHMGLLAAAAFYCIEWLVACFPALTYRVTPKKVAAVGALLIAAGYLVLSGMAISSLRAFIMVAIALTAILAERQVLSLRSVALAALFILITSPHSVLDVGFQLSFAATAGLVHIFEIWPKGDHKQQTMLDKTKTWLVMACVATFVAQASVAPFALYHFGSVSLFGAAANILVMPFMSLIMMPMCLLGLLALFADCFWIFAPLLRMAADSLLILAAVFAKLPMSSAYLWQMSVSSFAIILAIQTLGLIAKNRTVFAACILSAVAAGFLLEKTPPRTLLLSGSRPNIYYYEPTAMQEQVQLYGARAESFLTRSFLEHVGLDPSSKLRRLKPSCDGAGCIIDVGGDFIALPKLPSALALDCKRASILISDDYTACGFGTAPPLMISALALNKKAQLFEFRENTWREVDPGYDQPTRPWHALRSGK